MIIPDGRSRCRALGAIQHAPNLRSGLVETLIAQIESGELAPGQRLPTEQAIVAAAGVSRTVVREALASLRAKGLITTHQGLGAFVSNDPQPRSFSIVPNDLESIDEVLRVLELRIGVEVEAASFAALRRTDDDLERMAARLDALELSIRNGGAGVEEDFGFHRAILVATRNSYFARLLDTLGSAYDPAPMGAARPDGAARTQEICGAHAARALRDPVGHPQPQCTRRGQADANPSQQKLCAFRRAARPGWPHPQLSLPKLSLSSQAGRS